jgi:hypothetical protein
MHQHGHKVCHIVKNNIHVATPRYNCLQWVLDPIRIAGLTTRRYSGINNLVHWLQL